MTGAATGSAAPTRLPAELVERFAAAVERLWCGRRGLGLAVSGGTDSLALLLLAEAAMPGEIAVATVDHGLRAEAADECALVARICAARGIPCDVLTVSVAGGNVQDRARAARYEALLEWAMDRDIYSVATAHHIDDQVETLLMRLNRGSGVAGLAGVRDLANIGDHVPDIIRPMLGFRRAELAAVVKSAGLTPVQDPSNTDDRFDRVRMRRALADADWLDPAAIAVSAANLADAEEAVEWAVRTEWTDQVVVTDGEVRYRGDRNKWGAMRFVPREVLIRIVERAIRRFGGGARRSEAGRLVDRLTAGEGGNLGGVLATLDGKEWVFRPEPPRRA